MVSEDINFVFSSYKRANESLEFVYSDFIVPEKVTYTDILKTNSISCLTAFIHLFGVFFIGDLFGNSVSDLRGSFGLDNFIEIFAFYLLMFSNRFMGIWLIEKRKFRMLILVLLLVSIYLYFSRTMLVTFILVGLSLLGYTKMTKKTIQVVGIGIVFISLFYAYLFSIKLDRNSKGMESFLYKIKIAPEEIFKTKIDRENHKQLWDHWRGYEAKRAIVLINENPSSYILGTGFGSLVNLKFKAPVGDEGMKFISRLHNGYVFVFYKTGIIGLLMLLLFLFKLYLKVYNNNREDNKVFFTNRLLASIAIFYFFTSLIISGIYIPKDAIIFLLGGLLSTQDNLIKV